MIKKLWSDIILKPFEEAENEAAQKPTTNHKKIIAVLLATAISLTGISYFANLYELVYFLDSIGLNSIGDKIYTRLESGQIGQLMQLCYWATASCFFYFIIPFILIKGVFKEQIVPIEINTRKGIEIFDTDEHPKPETTLETLSGLKAAFKKEGSVTAGNASGINDGASALILANEKQAKKSNPLAKIISYGFGGVEPDEMGMGPIPASKMALKKSGLKVEDIDLIESNEAFAAQACAVNKQLGLDPEKVNVNGGAIALGHPVGATGSIIMTKLIYELRKRNGKYGLATMCIGGGQGIAVIIEAIYN